MSIANYTEMSDAVLEWLNREGFTDLEARVEDFIAFGQRRIMDECDLRAMQAVDPSFTIGTQVVAKPADFLRMRNLTIVTGWGTFEIESAPLLEVLKYIENSTPNRYAEQADNFYFGPPPDVSYTAVLQYYAALPILSTTETTNWFTDNFPEFLLAAALYEALLWLKDDVRAQVWAQQYARYKAQIERSERRSQYAPGTARVRMA